jgi:hypothetical protein
MALTVALSMFFLKGEQHPWFCGLPEEHNYCRQLDGEVVLEDQARVHDREKQGRVIRVLHHKVPVLDAEDGAEHPQKIREVQVPVPVERVQGLRAERGAVQRLQEELPLA